MKNAILRSLVFVAVITMAGFSIEAGAVYLEGLERPQYQVNLEILEASGEFAEINQYGLTHFTVDGERTSGFNLRTNDFRYYAKLIIRYTEDLGCGSKRHFAVEEAGYKNLGAEENYLRIVVIDHTERRCDDDKVGISALVYSGPKFLDDSLGEEADDVLMGEGVSEFIYTIM